MRKRLSIGILLILVLLAVSGCGKMSKKKIEEVKKETTNYIKNNMTSSWIYSPEKITIDDEFNAEIKIYNVLDLSDCVGSAKESYKELKENLDDESYLKKVSIYCEFNDEKIGHVDVENIKELNIDKIEQEMKVYDSNNNEMTIDENFYQTQKNEFISKCQSYSYRDIFRNSEDYISKYAVFTGEVIQVLDNDEFYDIRINVTKDEYGYYIDSMFASVPKSYFNGRILEGDILTMYGRLSELTTYESIFGQEVTIPTIYVRYAELNN